MTMTPTPLVANVPLELHTVKTAPDVPDVPDVDPDAPTRRYRRRLTTRLLTSAAVTTDDLARKRLRDRVVCLNLDVAESVAARFRNRGIPEEDLVQVAYLGLVKAVQRFDPAYERDFLAFAVPTMRGEVRRHFRDHGWAIRPPRQIQELQAQIGSAADALVQALGRPARPAEIAAFLDEQEADILAAMSANGCFTPASLDTPTGPGDASMLVARLETGANEHHAVDARVILAPAVKKLSERDRRILYLRFFEGWNQREIGDQIGVTQMQVSRLLARILRDLRRSLETEPVARPVPGDLRHAEGRTH